MRPWVLLAGLAAVAAGCIAPMHEQEEDDDRVAPPDTAAARDLQCPVIAPPGDTPVRVNVSFPEPNPGDTFEPPDYDPGNATLRWNGTTHARRPLEPAGCAVLTAPASLTRASVQVEFPARGGCLWTNGSTIELRPAGTYLDLVLRTVCQ